MINRINVLIEVNLKLLYKAENNFLNLKDFEDDFGNQFQNPKSFAEIMQKKELITQNPNENFGYKLTEIGKKISKNGGWLEHLKNQKKIENEIVKVKPKKFSKNLLITFFIMAFLGFIITFYYFNT